MTAIKRNQFLRVKKLALIPILLITVLLFNIQLNAKVTTVIEPTNSFAKVEKEIISNLFSRQAIVADTVRTKVNENTTASDTNFPSATNDITKIENTYAEYPGGLKVIRGLVMRHFRLKDLIDERGTMKTNIVINIDKQGKVTKVFAFGTNKKFNDEAYRAFQKANGNKIWKPATENGIPVEAEMVLPLSIHTE